MKHFSNLRAPNDEELFASIFGKETLDEERRRHVEHCPTCQQHLKDYQKTHHTLLSGLYRISCPSPALLSLYSEQKLPVKQEAFITSHLSECVLCSDEVTDICDELARFDPFPLPSRMRIPEPAAEPFWHLLKEGMKVFIAQLVTDPAPGMRGLRDMPNLSNPDESTAGSAASIWPWRYVIEPYHLAFQPQLVESELQLIGMFEKMTQTQFKVLEGVVVDLYDASPPVRDREGKPATPPEKQRAVLSTTLDDLGNFTFDAISPGNYFVIVHLPDCELVVQGLCIT